MLNYTTDMFLDSYW